MSSESLVTTTANVFCLFGIYVFVVVFSATENSKTATDGESINRLDPEVFAGAPLFLKFYFIIAILMTVIVGSQLSFNFYCLWSKRKKPAKFLGQLYKKVSIAFMITKIVIPILMIVFLFSSKLSNTLPLAAANFGALAIYIYMIYFDLLRLNKDVKYLNHDPKKPDLAAWYYGTDHWKLPNITPGENKLSG